MRLKLYRFLMTLLACVTVRSVHAEDLIYGIAGSNTLSTYRFDSGEELVVGKISYPQIRGLVFDSSEQRLLALANDGSIVSIDPATAQSTVLYKIKAEDTSPPSGGGFFGLELQITSHGERQLLVTYVGNQTQLFRINISTPQFTTEHVGTLGAAHVDSIALNHQTSQLVGVDRLNGALVVIDPMSAKIVQSLSLIADQHAPTGLAFDSLGSLLLVFEDGLLGSYNFANGRVTPISVVAIRASLTIASNIRDPQCPGCFPTAKSIFESSTLKSWSGLIGSNSGGNITWNALGIVNGRHAVASCPSIDPYAGATVPQVIEGQYSIKMGNDSYGAPLAEHLTKVVPAVPGNTSVKFMYSVVMNTPAQPHSKQNQAFFAYSGTCQPSPGVNIFLGSGSAVADLSDPYFHPAPNSSAANPVMYHTWDCVKFDTTPCNGAPTRLDFTTSHCSFGGHFSYAYIDGFCEDLMQASFTMDQKACGNQLSIFADGSASTFDSSHLWSIEESDSNGGRNPSTEVSQWFVGQEAGKIDLRKLYKDLGHEFKCNTYYRIKLAIKNGCVDWKEQVKLLHIGCPVADAGPDRLFCPRENLSFQLGTPGNPNYTYQWTPANAVNNPHSAQPTSALIPPETKRKYTVVVTDKDGCAASDSMEAEIAQPISVSVHQTFPLLCGRDSKQNYELTADTSGGPITSAGWNTGSSSNPLLIPATTLPPYSAATYTYTASNRCFSASSSTTLKAFTGKIANIPYYPNAINPKSSIVKNTHFNFSDARYYCNELNAYNITEYRFFVYDRWGGAIAQLYGGLSEGFPNCTVPNWDGRATESTAHSTAGQLVPTGQYSWVFWYKNCSSGNEWVRYNRSGQVLYVIY